MDKPTPTGQGPYCHCANCRGTILAIFHDNTPRSDGKGALVGRAVRIMPQEYQVSPGCKIVSTNPNGGYYSDY